MKSRLLFGLGLLAAVASGVFIFQGRRVEVVDRSAAPQVEESGGDAGDAGPGGSSSSGIGRGLREPVAPSLKSACSAVILDDRDLAPIPRLRVEGKSAAGLRFSTDSDPAGGIVLPAGSWQLEAPSPHYRLHGDLVVARAGAAGLVVWATRVARVRLRVLENVPRRPVAGATVTVDHEPFVNEPTPLPTFVTDQEGFLKDKAGAALFLHGGVAVSISHPAHKLEEAVLPTSLGERSLDEGVYEVLIEPSGAAPRAILCVDEQDLPIAGVVVHAYLPDRRFLISEVYLGTTDAAGRLMLPGWTNQARLLTFGGSVCRASIACPASIAPQVDCEIYLLRRSCIVELQVRDWRRGMAVRWNFEIVDYRPGRCEPGTEIDSFIDRGSGRFEARLPRGLRVRLLCRDKALREWEARVTAQSPSERIDVVLAPASLTRRLTLVPEGGVIEAVRVTTFEDARNLAEMAVALVEDAGEVSLLVPTDPCAVFVQAASGEVATLREGAGTEDARVMVTFRGIRSVEFVIVDVEGRPIPDVLLHVRERQGTLATGAVLSPLEVHQLEQVRSRLGWMQKVYTGGNQRTVALTRDGRARVRLPLGLYAVEVRTLPWRGSVLPVYPLREGGMFQVLPGASDVGVKVVTDRPRRLTFELVTDATERIPEVWSLRHVASGKARKFRGRMCTVWAPEGRSKWEVRSGRSLLGSVEVPEAPRTWSGRVRILP